MIFNKGDALILLAKLLNYFILFNNYRMFLKKKKKSAYTKGEIANISNDLQSVQMILFCFVLFFYFSCPAIL